MDPTTLKNAKEWLEDYPSSLNLCKEFIHKFCKRTKTIRIKTYGMKHIVEDYSDFLGNHVYIASSVFALAAFELGIPMKRGHMKNSSGFYDYAYAISYNSEKIKKYFKETSVEHFLKKI